MHIMKVNKRQVYIIDFHLLHTKNIVLSPTKRKDAYHWIMTRLQVAWQEVNQVPYKHTYNIQNTQNTQTCTHTHTHAIIIVSEQAVLAVL